MFTANAELYTDLKFSAAINNTSKASDHASFWRHNILAVYGIQSARSTNEVMHTPLDTLGNPDGFNNPEFHKEVVKAGIAALADMAKPIDDGTSINNVPVGCNCSMQYNNKSISVAGAHHQHNDLAYL